MTGAVASETRGSRVRVRVPVVLAGAALVVLLAWALVPNLFAGDPLAIDPAAAFQAPSGQHVFGTDESGRDVFARVVHGTRDSLTIGVLATLLGVGIGTVLALIAGLGGRVCDRIVGWITEAALSFPTLLLALLLIVVVGPGVGTVIVAVGISAAPGYARILRGQVLRVRQSGYVEASRILGTRFISLRRVLPNVVAPVFAIATLGLGQAIVWAATLSFLGLGAAPPAPEWGAMLSQGRLYVQLAWWLTVFPGLAVVVTGVAATVVGRFLATRGAR